MPLVCAIASTVLSQYDFEIALPNGGGVFSLTPNRNSMVAQMLKLRWLPLVSLYIGLTLQKYINMCKTLYKIIPKKLGRYLYKCYLYIHKLITMNEQATETKFKSLQDVIRKLSDEDVCRRFLEKQRWGGKPHCPQCGTDKPYKLKDGKTYKCRNSECYKRFTVTVGTVFENSKIKLNQWLIAIYICTAHKKGISSHQLARDLNITQKTAWFMLHRIREILKEKMPAILSGTGVVELDETYYGAPEKNKHKSKRTEGTQGRNTLTKKPIFGMIQRGGKLVMSPVPDVKGETLKGIVADMVAKDSTIVTDEWGSYNGLHVDYTHLRVEHGAGEYARGIVHVNNLEGAWSLLKRGITGIYHSVSVKHLSRYCDEYAYRYNTRDVKDVDRFELSLGRMEGRLTYKTLISKP